jgi:signal peptidase I
MECGNIIVDGLPIERTRIDDYVGIIRTGGAVEIAYQFRESMPNLVSYNVIEFDECGQMDNMRRRKIPKGAYFLLGDNRDWSIDSRFAEPGMIDRRNITSRIYARIWPLRAPL